MQLLGVYSVVAADSETVRHLTTRHKLSKVTVANVQAEAARFYQRYHPHEFLAYWYELWCDYEAAVGQKVSCMDPSRYKEFNGSYMRKHKL